ncbi:MAG: hypothetical protein AB1779_11775 [Candidatus Thermoplasmatota archaeon]
MNLYEIKERLSQSKKSIFTINEFSRIFNIKKSVASVYVNRMIKKKLLFRIERNKVSISDDAFTLSSQLIFPSYISLITALYLHNIVEQVVDKIYVLTTKKRKNINLFGTDVIFVQTKPELMFGYKRIEKAQSFIMLADLEKTIIDCLYFQRYCRLSYIITALGKADIRKVEGYAERLNKEVVSRRLGYLLDLLGKKNSLKRKTDTTYKLNSLIKKKGKFDKKWYLYINEEIR